MSNKSKYFCEHIRRLRGDRSQAEIANNIGISQQNYSRYESGVVMPKHEALHKIAKYYCVSIDDLLTPSIQQDTPPSTPTTPCRYPEACDLQREFSQVRDELTSVDARLSAMTAQMETVTTQLETVTRLLGVALGNGLSQPKEPRHRAAG